MLCKQYVAPDWTDDVEFIAVFLFIHQYVEAIDANHEKLLYRVICGVRKGLWRSASVVNSLFAISVEHCFLTPIFGT